ncbi:hypothetical protein [Vibrio sp. ArtGut-C1]|uniref:hypothetical protein n=1 Tax=Vibrio sp. ArtGut-C1 TaxID=2259137 RepID=UPI000A19A773|nr:hypothetical protein [Vibrio sp. ArtGut-C1]
MIRRRKIAINTQIIETVSSSQQQETNTLNVDLLLKFSDRGTSDVDMSAALPSGSLAVPDFSKGRRKLLVKFCQYIRQSLVSDASKRTRAVRFSLLLKALDEIGFYSNLESKGEVQKALSKYREMLVARYKNPNVKFSKRSANDYRKTLSSISKGFFDLSQKEFEAAFPTVSNRTSKLTGARIEQAGEEGKSFTVKDERVLVKVLMALAEHYQDMYEKGFHLSDSKANRLTINYDDKAYTSPVHHTASIRHAKYYFLNISTFMRSLMFAATTGMNKEAIYSVKSKDIQIGQTQQNLIFIHWKCNRKGKAITDTFCIEKCKLRFFEEVIAHSKSVPFNDDDLIFPFVNENGTVRPFPETLIYSYVKTFFARSSILVGEYGEILLPKFRKLRNTYAHNAITDESKKHTVLHNSIGVARKNYGSTNAHENNKLLSDGMFEYASMLIQEPHDIEKELENVVVTDKPNSHLTKTSDGGECLNSLTSIEANKYQRKLDKRDIEIKDKKHCANVFACMTCPNHIFVDSIAHLYVLVSFRQHLLNSRSSHQAGGLFGDKKLLNTTIRRLDSLLNTRFKKSNVEAAFVQLESNGLHPIWEMEGIF